jgi:Xaa-Pro aminopeptidase
VIRSGDLVVVDFGALVDGYHSDMTRTVAVGAPDSEAARMLEVVLAAQAAGVESVRSGVQAATVDAACREVITPSCTARATGWAWTSTRSLASRTAPLLPFPPATW